MNDLYRDMMFWLCRPALPLLISAIPGLTLCSFIKTQAVTFLANK